MADGTGGGGGWVGAMVTAGPSMGIQLEKYVTMGCVIGKRAGGDGTSRFLRNIPEGSGEGSARGGGMDIGIQKSVCGICFNPGKGEAG